MKSKHSNCLFCMKYFQNKNNILNLYHIKHDMIKQVICALWHIIFYYYFIFLFNLQFFSYSSVSEGVFFYFSKSHFRMGSPLFTWRHKATMWNVSSTFCSTRLPLMTSRWITWQRYMWRLTAATTGSPNCSWTRGPTPMPGLWYDPETSRHHISPLNWSSCCLRNGEQMAQIHI